MANIRKIKVNNTEYDIAPVGSSIYYATCATGASTSAKVASTTNGDFKKTVGSMVRVKFTNANTYNGTATLNVDNTGAANIARVGTTLTTRYYWTAGEVVDFVYDGTNYVMSDKGTATTSYYGLTKLSSSTSSTSTALAATPSAVKAAYDLAATKADADDVYTKTETDTLLADKADVSALDDYYTKTAADALLAGKVDKNNKVTGYFTGTYITGGYYEYVEINNVVTFYIEYIPNVNVSSSIGACNINLPAPKHTVKYPVTPESIVTYNAFGFIYNSGSNVQFNALGTATQDTKYFVQGSYIKA